MTTPAVIFDDVYVRYRSQKLGSLKEWLVRGFRRPPSSEFTAVRGVSFEVGQGETLGLIGGNGAGKSTLLRATAGIIVPSSGSLTTRGVVAPLIELGTGFDIELSGRENIFFNGALLGRSRALMRARLDEIIEFAELGEFIDSPIRTYSTGMIARLAFSIATTVDADLVLLDEILSVGDASFRERCENRIQQFCSGGATVIIVSHDLASVTKLCKRVVWLDGGEVRADGAAFEVATEYQRVSHAEVVATAAHAVS